MKNYLSLSPSHFFRCPFLFLVLTYYLLLFVIFLKTIPNFSHRSEHCSFLCIVKFYFYKSYKLCACSHHSSLYSRFSRVKNSKKKFQEINKNSDTGISNLSTQKNSIKSQKQQIQQSKNSVFCHFLRERRGRSDS